MDMYFLLEKVDFSHDYVLLWILWSETLLIDENPLIWKRPEFIDQFFLKRNCLDSPTVLLFSEFLLAL